MFFSTTCAAVSLACAPAGSVKKVVSEKVRKSRRVLRNIDGSLLLGLGGGGYLSIHSNTSLFSRSATLEYIEDPCYQSFEKPDSTFGVIEPGPETATEAPLT
jgi:hypothetical protein